MSQSHCIAKNTSVQRVISSSEQWTRMRKRHHQARALVKWQVQAAAPEAAEAAAAAAVLCGFRRAVIHRWTLMSIEQSRYHQHQHNLNHNQLQHQQ